MMRQLAVLGLLLAFERSVIADRSILQSAVVPDNGICGDANTQVTICFPGSQSAASCEYGLSERTDEGASMANPCPLGQLFNQSCTSIPGLVFIAYGPCQDQLKLTQDPNANVAQALQIVQQQLPISDWIQTLGLNGVEEVGALYLRGYAYQPPQPVTNLDILPNLSKIGSSNRLDALVSGTTALTILGAEIPRFSNITNVGGGLLIQNVPNQNFTSDFGPLEGVSGSVFIAGNTAMTSLAGLEQLNSSAIGNLEILSNNALVDISALSSALGCDSAGQTSVSPGSTLVGAIEVLPANSNGTEHCLLSTVAQACQFIGNKLCPTGTASAYAQFQTIKNSSSLGLVPRLAPSPM